MMIISGNKYEAGYQIVAMADRRLQTTKDNWKPYFMKIIVTWKFLRCFLWYSANWKLRGLWDAMCAIYRCLIPSSLYQPGSNSVMRNIIPNNSFKIHFLSVMSDVRSTMPQVSAWIWSPIKTFIRLFSRDCFGFVNACFWMLLFFSCCVFVLDFEKDDKCGKSDGSSSTLLIVCKCSNLLQR